jgi:hypothetical protein
MTPFFGQRLEVAFCFLFSSSTWQSVIVNQIHDSDIMTVGKKSMEQIGAKSEKSGRAFNRVSNCSDAHV